MEQNYHAIVGSFPQKIISVGKEKTQIKKWEVLSMETFKNFVCDNLYFYRFKQATEENARLSDTVTLWMAGKVH